MLNGKTAVVTGGSRGIGEAIVYKLASMGANIAVIYAGNAAAAEKVCKKCGQRYSVEARAYQCNVADFSAVKEAVVKIRADFGTVQLLVNNAGITHDGLLAMMKEEDFDAVLDTNLKGRTVHPGTRRLYYQYHIRFGHDGQCRAMQLFRIKGWADRTYKVRSEGACTKRYPL